MLVLLLHKSFRDPMNQNNILPAGYNIGFPHSIILYTPPPSRHGKTSATGALLQHSRYTVTLLLLFVFLKFSMYK